MDEVVATVLEPTVNELRRRGTPFSGLLYAGLALTSRGVRVIEFNARFGDPETQAVLARLRTPLGGLLYAAATGTLADFPALRWSDGAAVTVVVAAHGYPAEPRKGDAVEGLAEIVREDGPDAYVLHAGTRADADGTVRSAGGRVLSVTATGADLTEARASGPTRPSVASGWRERTTARTSRSGPRRSRPRPTERPATPDAPRPGCPGEPTGASPDLLGRPGLDRTSGPGGSGLAPEPRTRTPRLARMTGAVVGRPGPERRSGARACAGARRCIPAYLRLIYLPPPPGKSSPQSHSIE